MYIIRLGRVPITLLWMLLILQAPLYVRAQNERQTIRISDNSSITMLGWSYGKYHELVPGRESRHIDIAPPDRPDANEIASCETEEDALVFWIKRSGPESRVDNVSIHLAWMRKQVRAADENGHEIAPRVALWRMNRSESPQRLTDDPIAISSFPRRGRTVILRVYSPDSLHVLGEFKIPNPVLGRIAPPFVADRFPVTKSSGDLALTLAPMVNGRIRHYIHENGLSEIFGDLPQTPGGYRVAPDESPRSVSHASFTFRGKPSTHWALSTTGAGLWDAAGNHMETDFTGTGSDKLYLPRINLGEPVRLRIGAVQKVDRGFTPDRVWTVPGVSVPAPGASNRTERVMHMENCDLRLLGVAGAGVRKFGQTFISAAPPGFMSVVLHLSYEDRQYPEFELKVTDAQGRTILPDESQFEPFLPGYEVVRSTWFGHGGSSGLYYGDYVYWVKVPRGSGKINLTFGLNRERYFEFVLPDSTR